MLITQEEATQIARNIYPKFQSVVANYDFTKYPANIYAGLQKSFSELTATNQDIHDALVWKYGHWGKRDFPQHHKDLIQLVQDHWPQFIKTNNYHRAICTFQWWKNVLQNENNKRYITVAFITHLVHHAEPFPIIDQHNFRAMNYLIKQVRHDYKHKQMPSKWDDIIDLKDFMQTLLPHLHGVSFSDLDKFLMMYGRNNAPRDSRNKSKQA